MTLKTKLALAAVLFASNAYANNWEPIYSSETPDRLAINKQIDINSVKRTDRGVEFKTLTIVHSLQEKARERPPMQIYETSVANCDENSSYVKKALVVTGKNFRVIDSSETGQVTTYPSGSEAVDAMFYTHICRK